VIRFDSSGWWSKSRTAVTMVVTAMLGEAPNDDDRYGRGEPGFLFEKNWGRGERIRSHCSSLSFYMVPRMCLVTPSVEERAPARGERRTRRRGGLQRTEGMRTTSSWDISQTKGYGCGLGRAGLEVAGLLCRLLLDCVGQVSFYSIFFLYFLFLPIFCF
jgi:hypothetical protein